MSSNDRNRRWAGGVGMAVSAAFAAAVIGLANAPAAGADTDLGPFQDLFGDSGINAWTASADSLLLTSDPTLAGSLDASVDNFLADAPISTQFPEGDDPFSFYTWELDPSSFTDDPTLAGGLPDNAIGDFAVALDYTLFASGIGGNDVGISDSLGFLANIPGIIEGWAFLLGLVFAG
jgi:hypothetical protein